MFTAVLESLLMIVMPLLAVFLILLVLVQRGRGGGLAGALGGMGGQSAFGAKAGDTFTKITIWAATFWILLCMSAVVLLNRPEDTIEKSGVESISPVNRGEDEKEDKEDDDKPATGGAVGTSDSPA